MHITAIVPIYNEEELLPFFLDYYTTFCNYIVFYDGMSTDRSREIVLDRIGKTPCHIELRVNQSIGTVDIYNETLADCPNQSLHYIRTHGWRTVFPYRDDLPQWVLVVDCDEFVWHPLGVRQKLAAYEARNIGFPSPTNIQMLSRKFPTHGTSLLTHQVVEGYIDRSFQGVKRLAFNAKLKGDFNFKEFGYRSPNENTMDDEPIKDRLKVLHYPKMGFKFFKDRIKDKGDRVSSHNHQFGLSYHYYDQANMTEADFENLYSHPGFVKNIHDVWSYPSFCVLPHEVVDRPTDSPFN